MDKNTRLSPCAADALGNIRTILVDGKPIGIAGFDAACAAVVARGITRDAEIRTELLRILKAENYIPHAREDRYAEAFFAVFLQISKNHS